MKLASFDIFDTSLIRKLYSPESVFQSMAESLFGIGSEKAENLISWRIGDFGLFFFSSILEISGNHGGISSVFSVFLLCGSVLWRGL